MRRPIEETEAIWTDAVGQAEAIRTAEVAATELVDAYLERIERIDPILRAFVSLDAERARAEARAVDDAVARRDVSRLGPFSGVTITIKDVLDVTGLPTTHSCKVLADNIAIEDSPQVARLRDAGFIVLGKTNVPEFCTSMTSSELNGTCRNPWDLDRTPAGSSGGAAAALAAGLCAVAHGTDGAGSVRVPAAYCGLVGTKPTRGRIAFGPELGHAYYGTSVDGILSRSVRDAATALDVLEGWHDGRPALSRPFEAFGDGLCEPKPLRIAVTTESPFGEVHDEPAQAARATADLLESLGHHVTERTPHWSIILEAAFGPMSAPGPGLLVAAEDVDRVEPRNRWLVEASHRLTVVEHARYAELVRARSREFLQFWDDVDVLVSPTAGMLPPSVDWAPWNQSREDHMATFATFANFAHPFNLSGQPALSLPLAWSAGGLPIGVQLAGRRNEEATLFNLAFQLERVAPWADRRPPALV